MSRWVVSLTAVSLGFLLSSPCDRPSRAADQTVLGQSFSVKDPQPGVDPSLRSAVVLGKELLSDDVLNGNPLADGATVQIIANGNVATDQVFTLPAGAYETGSRGWKTSGSPVIGYTYKDPLGLVGPVKSALIKRANNGTFLVKVVLKGALGPGPQPHITLVPPAPGSEGGMIFTINGGDTYCVRFGGPAGGQVVNSPSRGVPNKAFKIVSNRNVQTTEAGCPQPTNATSTSTTTSSSTTSTSSTSSTTSTSTSTSVSTSTSTSTSTSSSSSSTSTSTPAPTSSTSTSTSSSSSTSVVATTSTSSSASTVATTSTSSTTSTTLGTDCGNGIVEGTEQCDDANDENTDACTNACRNAFCGDGFVRTGVEQCDDGNNTPGDGCNASCVLEPPVCGNGVVQAGETCDDGNTLNGDSCPANCVIGACTPTATRVDVQVKFARPNGVTVGAIVVFLDYPDGRISIPGSGGEPSVVARISNTPANFSSSTFDLDYAVREALVASGRILAPGAIFDVSFDLCMGETAPRRQDFTCTVESAATPQGANLSLTGITCSVTIL